MIPAARRRSGGQAGSDPTGGTIPGTGASERLAAAVLMIVSALWAAGTLGFEAVFLTGGDLGRLSLATLLFFALFLALGLYALVAWRPPEAIAAGPPSDPASPWPLGGLLLLGALLPMVVFRPDTDDSYYMANVIYALAHPGAPITAEVRGLVAQPLEPFTSSHWATATAYDYLFASTSRLTGLDPLDLRYFWLPGLAGAVLVAGSFLILKDLTRRQAEALVGTFAIVALYMIWREVHRDPGNFAFYRMFQAKSVVMTAVLPGFAAVFYRFLRAPSVPLGIALVLVSTGAAGMSSSAVFLIGAAAAGVTLGAMAAEPVRSGRILVLALLGGVLSAAFLFPLVRALTDPLPLGMDSPANVGWPTTFLGHVRFMGKTTWLLLAVSVAAVAWLGRGAVRRFVLGWTAAVVILFANPLTGQILIDHALGPNAYWRIFYTLPWVPLAGLTVVLVRRLLPASLSRATVPAIAAVILVAFALSVVLVWRDEGRIAVLPPAWKIDPDLRAAAEAVAGATPEGPMLAPPELSPYVLLVDGNRPQMRMRTSGIEVWALAAGRPDLSETRILATNALSEADERGVERRSAEPGDPRIQPQLEALSAVVAESNPASVVFDADVTGRDMLETRLTDLGYGQSAETDRYLIWTRAR